ncbi:succinylglutamate desuccinylase/aspartoacylase domain-containing protein [Pseudonocardia sp. GCM10023141]|uniref:succinylglutamate desuccinylase/aspartoacylase domain-containing protein n=1 Tax=Pseudonocardia sp. GCM10023141 TaxID=3252653 RepID=UPI00361DA10B
MSDVVYDLATLDLTRPGISHHRLAFPLDGSWGSSLVPITVINGTRPGPPGEPDPPGVAVFGGTHGDEYEGQVAVTRLCRDLDPELLRGHVVLMPQLSESACRAHSRTSPEDGMNMNRAFPGRPDGSLSSRIAHFVSSRVLPGVDVVLDLHAGGHQMTYALCTSFHPLADAEATRRTVDTARLFGTPFVFVYSRQLASGLLTDHAEDLGKITLGGEFGRGGATSRVGTEHAYEGVRNVLRHYGLLDEPVVALGATPSRVVAAPSLDGYVPAPRDGVWEPTADLGDDVVAGDLIGRLHDFAEHPTGVAEIRAHRDGVLIASHYGARCEQGNTIFVIAEEVRA